MKRFLKVCLSVVLLLALLTTAAFAEETADNVTYSYEDGVLTVLVPKEEVRKSPASTAIAIAIE